MRVHVKLISSYLLVPRAATAQNGSGERKVTLHLPLPLLSLSPRCIYPTRKHQIFLSASFLSRRECFCILFFIEVKILANSLNQFAIVDLWTLSVNETYSFSIFSFDISFFFFFWREDNLVGRILVARLNRFARDEEKQEKQIGSLRFQRTYPFYSRAWLHRCKINSARLLTDQDFTLLIGNCWSHHFIASDFSYNCVHLTFSHDLVSLLYLPVSAIYK